LIDKGKPKSTHNTYSFRNPLMRAYVRLKMLQEKQTQMSL